MPRQLHISFAFQKVVFCLVCLALFISGGKLFAQFPHSHYYICSNDTFVYPKMTEDAKYKIYYGDGKVDSGYSPMKYVYTKPGDYVTKVIRTSKTRKDSFIYYTHVGSLPTVSFSAKPNCSVAAFTNSCPDSIMINGGWQWDFGDGTGSTEKSPIHLYKNQGHYVAQLKYGTHSACNRSVSRPLTITLPIDFGFDYHVNDNAALFHPKDTTGKYYHWDFGDKDTSDKTTPFHTYTDKGKYPVSLLMESKSGCISYYMDSLTAGSTGIKPLDGNGNLFQAYPNPFNNTLNIHYELTGNRNVSLKLYDATGKLTRTITDELQHAGRYDVQFHPSEHAMKAGMYVLIAVFGEVYLSQRLIME